MKEFSFKLGIGYDDEFNGPESISKIVQISGDALSEKIKTLPGVKWAGGDADEDPIIFYLIVVGDISRNDIEAFLEYESNRNGGDGELIGWDFDAEVDYVNTGRPLDSLFAKGGKVTEEDLEWFDGGDGVEYEVWQDPKTEQLYRIPIERISTSKEEEEGDIDIKRDFKNAQKVRSVWAAKFGDYSKGGPIKQKKFYTTSRPMDISDFIEIEVEERGNYTKKEVNAWIKKYKITDSRGSKLGSGVLWVALEPHIAARYQMDSGDWDNAKEVYEKDKSKYNVFVVGEGNGTIIEESDDGDDGYLMALKVDAPIKDEIFEYLDNNFSKGGRPNWIKDAIKNPGALRKTAKAKGLVRNNTEKLSMTDLHNLEDMGGKTAKRAHLAETLKGFAGGGNIAYDTDSWVEDNGDGDEQVISITIAGITPKSFESYYSNYQDFEKPYKAWAEKNGYDSINHRVDIFSGKDTNSTGSNPDSDEMTFTLNLGRTKSETKISKGEKLLENDLLKQDFILEMLSEKMDGGSRVWQGEGYYENGYLLSSMTPSSDYVRNEEQYKHLYHNSLEAKKIADRQKEIEERAYKVFDGKKYTLYSSGTEKKVSDYVKEYGIPKNALAKYWNDGREYRLYLYFEKPTPIESKKYLGQFTLGEDDGEKPMFTKEELELMEEGYVIELEFNASRRGKAEMESYQKEFKFETKLTNTDDEFGGRWRVWKKVEKLQVGGKLEKIPSAELEEIYLSAEKSGQDLDWVLKQHGYTMADFENSVDKNKMPFLFGGKINQTDCFQIDDTFYSWKYNPVTLYALYMSKSEIILSELIDHPVLFKTYKDIGEIKVQFKNGKENSAKIQLPKTTNITNHFDKILITLTLNFEYYDKNRKELHTIESKEPENSKEAILLHELQHVLQACHNRSFGTETTKGIRQADARIDTLRHLELSKKITKEEKAEYAFYKSLKGNLLHDFFYYNNQGEREARLVVRQWLATKKIRYVDPLTEFFGIEVVLNEGGPLVVEENENDTDYKLEYISNLIRQGNTSGYTPYWKLNTTISINDSDTQHIAELVEQGYHEGEIVSDEGKTGWWSIEVEDTFAGGGQVGKRIKMVKMANDPNPIEPSTMGTIKMIDGLGQLHVNWDNGRTLAVIPGVDEYEIDGEMADGGQEYSAGGGVNQVKDAIKFIKDSGYGYSVHSRVFGGWNLKQNGMHVGKYSNEQIIDFAETIGYNRKPATLDFLRDNWKPRKFADVVHYDGGGSMQENVRNYLTKKYKENDGSALMEKKATIISDISKHFKLPIDDSESLFTDWAYGVYGAEIVEKYDGGGRLSLLKKMYAKNPTKELEKRIKLLENPKWEKTKDGVFVLERINKKGKAYSDFWVTIGQHTNKHEQNYGLWEVKRGGWNDATGFRRTFVTKRFETKSEAEKFMNDWKNKVQ